MKPELIGILFLLLGCGVIGWLGALLLRRHAEKIGLISDPNHRSSHTIPTPHGGGIGIVIAGVASALILPLCLGFSIHNGNWWLAIGACFAGALISLIDDFRHIPAGIRLLTQLLVTTAIVYAFYPLGRLETPLMPLTGLWLAIPVGIVLLWWLNLFNFMDGIDGIAGAQALFMCVAAAGIMIWQGHSHLFYALPIFWWALCLGAACLGFLLLNWPPAKIFMGDVGSVFLACAISVLLLYSVKMHLLSYESWLILGATFIADASLMVIIRIIKRERLHEAHRNHAYQRLSRHWKSHKAVTILYSSINVLWLLPLAMLCLKYPTCAWYLVGLAYLPLLAGYLYIQKKIA